MRLDSNYNKIEGLEVLSADDLLNIEIMAKTLELDACLESLYLTLADLSELETTIVQRVHRKGRNKGVQEAGDNLFSQMRTRNGTVACMEYLKVMSNTFTIQVTPVGGSSGGFHFNVFPPGTTPETVSTQNSPEKPSTGQTVVPIKK